MRHIFNTHLKFFSLYKNEHRISQNGKKFRGDFITSIEVDTVTGEYRAIIPEWIINEMGWYEDTNLTWKIDDNDVIITESDE